MLSPADAAYITGGDHGDALAIVLLGASRKDNANYYIVMNADGTFWTTEGIEDISGTFKGEALISLSKSKIYMEHLKTYKSFNVDILVTESNITTYLIRQTQGAEYGEEAEKFRAAFEDALNVVFGKGEAECNACGWHGNKEDMQEDEDDEEILICPVCNSENIYYL